MQKIGNLKYRILKDKLAKCLCFLIVFFGHAMHSGILVPQPETAQGHSSDNIKP